jgi:GNAT superfamily N-acetyltransferase
VAYPGLVITIRQAGETDAATIRRITVAAYRHYVMRLGREPVPMVTDYASAIRAGGAWIAEDDGVPVGLAIMQCEADHLLLDNLAVLPGAQGQGVGSRLLAFTEEQARHLGYAEVRLFTSETMVENIAYYPRRGYTETHRGGPVGFVRVFFSKPVPPSA